MAVVLWVHCVTALLAFFLAEIDQREHRLPDWGTLGLWAATATVTGWLALQHELLEVAESAVVSSASTVLLLWLLAELPGRPMGFGDVKLAGALSMQLGWYGLTWWASFLVIAFVTGGSWSLVQWARGRLGPHDHLAFGPFLLIGWWLALVLSANSLGARGETI